MADNLDIELDEDNIPDDLTTIEILKYLEFAINIIMLCDSKILQDDSKYGYNNKYWILDENINIVLEHLNFCKREINNEEKILLQ